jgi:hypothetical protein
MLYIGPVGDVSHPIQPQNGLERVNICPLFPSGDVNHFEGAQWLRTLADSWGMVIEGLFLVCMNAEDLTRFIKMGQAA